MVTTPRIMEVSCGVFGETRGVQCQQESVFHREKCEWSAIEVTRKNALENVVFFLIMIKHLS